MNEINEIIVAEMWEDSCDSPVEGLEEHNASLNRIQEAVEKHVAELTAKCDQLGKKIDILEDPSTVCGICETQRDLRKALIEIDRLKSNS